MRISSTSHDAGRAGVFRQLLRSLSRDGRMTFAGRTGGNRRHALSPVSGGSPARAVNFLLGGIITPNEICAPTAKSTTPARSILKNEQRNAENRPRPRIDTLRDRINGHCARRSPDGQSLDPAPRPWTSYRLSVLCSVFVDSKAGVPENGHPPSDSAAFQATKMPNARCHDMD